MVAEVYGIIADKKILFSVDEGGLWSAKVPLAASGNYIVALFAVDDAGNETYFATILYTVDVQNLSVTISVIDYGMELNDKYDADISICGYDANILKFETVEAGEQSAD